MRNSYLSIGGRLMVLSLGHPRATTLGFVPEHILLAEKALGKPLPVGSEVHHFTEDQLVICQDQSYHRLLHVRQRALESCGNADWRKCHFCKKYDSPDKMILKKVAKRPLVTSMFHRACKNKSLKDWRLSRCV